MSLEAMTAVWKLDLDPRQKLTLLALADYADHNWQCFPSYDKLAEKTRQSHKTVRRHIDGLVEDGWLKKDPAYRADGGSRSNMYTIIPKGGVVNLTTGGVMGDHRGVVNGDHRGVVICDHPNITPISNHHKEPSMSAPDAADVPAANGYSKEFEEFWLAYPRTRTMSKKSAYGQWRRLGKQDRAAATASLPAFKADVEKQDHSTLHAERFLSKRVFDGYAEEAAVDTKYLYEADMKFLEMRGGGAEAMDMLEAATGRRYELKEKLNAD
jgi:hypothetical protein